MKCSYRGLTTKPPVTVPSPGRWIVRATLSAGVLALAAGPFGALAVANADYKESDFASCLERDMPTDYCWNTPAALCARAPASIRTTSGSQAEEPSWRSSRDRQRMFHRAWSQTCPQKLFWKSSRHRRRRFRHA